MKTLEIGQSAPLFSLKDQNSDSVTLGDYIGKEVIVLYFYPKAMTPGCTTQACGIRDHADVFKKNKVTVFGLSRSETWFEFSIIGRRRTSGC